MHFQRKLNDLNYVCLFLKCSVIQSTVSNNLTIWDLELVQQLGMYHAVTEDQGSMPNSHGRWDIIASNSGSRDLMPLDYRKTVNVVCTTFP